MWNCSGPSNGVWDDCTNYALNACDEHNSEDLNVLDDHDVGMVHNDVWMRWPLSETGDLRINGLSCEEGGNGGNACVCHCGYVGFCI